MYNFIKKIKKYFYLNYNHIAPTWKGELYVKQAKVNIIPLYFAKKWNGNKLLNA